MQSEIRSWHSYAWRSTMTKILKTKAAGLDQCRQCLYGAHAKKNTQMVPGVHVEDTLLEWLESPSGYNWLAERTMVWPSLGQLIVLRRMLLAKKKQDTREEPADEWTREVKKRGARGGECGLRRLANSKTLRTAVHWRCASVTRTHASGHTGKMMDDGGLRSC